MAEERGISWLRAQVAQLQQAKVQRQNALLSADPDWRDINAQLLWAQRWLQQYEDESKGAADKPGEAGADKK